MSRKVGLYVDAIYTYFACRERYQSTLDYEALINYVKDLGELKYAGVYGVARDNNSNRFCSKLMHLGYTLKTVKSHHQNNQCPAITLDATLTLNDIDLLVIVSNDSGLLPLIKKARELNKYIIVFGVEVNDEFRRYAQGAIEIPRDMCRPIQNIEAGG